MALIPDSPVPSVVRPPAGRSFRQNPIVLGVHFEDDLILFHPSSGAYFATDLMGARIWKALGPEGAALEGVNAAIVSDFEVDAEGCRESVERFVTRLLEAGLLEETSTPGRVRDPEGPSGGRRRSRWGGEVQLVRLDLAATGSGPFVFDNEMLDLQGNNMGGPVPS